MSVQVENLEKNMAKLTIEVSAQEFEKALDKAYRKNKGRINIPGFRKGKATRAVIEKMYGAGIFYEDAANFIIPEAYEDAVKESGLEVVSQPQMDITQIEKGSPFIFTAEVAVKPEVILGEYKGIEVEKANLEVTEEEVATELERIREQNSRTLDVDDRPTQDGDTVVIDFEGFVDGVPFEGGKDENYPLVLGSHTFVDNFEEQLVGKSIDEEVTVNVTFPEDYHSEELAGKPAMFKVLVKEIKTVELPELDDEFAQDVSEFDTLEEYKGEVKEILFRTKKAQADAAKEDVVVQKIIENATMDIPEPMIEAQVRQLADEFAQRIESQGLSVQQYFEMTGMDREKLLAQFKPQALLRIQSRLVLEAIVKAENIVATEEEVEKELQDLALSYQMEVEKFRSMFTEEQKEQFAEDVAVQKAADFVVAEAIEIEK